MRFFSFFNVKTPHLTSTQNNRHNWYIVHPYVRKLFSPIATFLMLDNKESTTLRKFETNYFYEIHDHYALDHPIVNIIVHYVSPRFKQTTNIYKQIYVLDLMYIFTG
jgi:hypothetical protein